MSNTKIAVGLLFLEETYTHGILDIINLINRQFPNNQLIIQIYNVDGSLSQTQTTIDSFLKDYSNYRMCLISERTSILTIIANYLKIKGLNIPNFSVSATSPSIKQLSNSLTYAPFDSYVAMSLFLIYVQYGMKQITILYESGTLDDIFIQSYIFEINKQANLLGIPVNVQILNTNINYQIKEYTHIVLLSNTNSLKNKYINPNFLNQIPKNCYITLSDLNNDCPDIFGSIPAIVLVPIQINYTTTSQLVYDNLTINKSLLYYGIYPLYDYLYTLVALGQTDLPLTISNYLSLNAFQENLQAWTNAVVYDEQLNGSLFGKYLGIFTKNVLIGDDSILFNQYNRGGLIYLPDSQSTFRMIGIVPFFQSLNYYNLNEYYKVYDESGYLLFVGYDLSTLNYHGLQVNTGTQCDINFLYSYNDEGYFNKLQKIYDLEKIAPRVDSTMSKLPTLKYLKIGNPLLPYTYQINVYGDYLSIKNKKLTIHKFINTLVLNKFTPVINENITQIVMVKKFIKDWPTSYLIGLIEGYYKGKRELSLIHLYKPEIKNRDLIFNYSLKGLYNNFNLDNSIVNWDDQHKLKNIVLSLEIKPPNINPPLKNLSNSSQIKIYAKIGYFENKHFIMKFYSDNFIIFNHDLINNKLMNYIVPSTDLNYIWQNKLIDSTLNVLISGTSHANKKFTFFNLKLTNPQVTQRRIIFDYIYSGSDSIFETLDDICVLMFTKLIPS